MKLKSQHFLNIGLVIFIISFLNAVFKDKLELILYCSFCIPFVFTAVFLEYKITLKLNKQLKNFKN